MSWWEELGIVGKHTLINVGQSLSSIITSIPGRIKETGLRAVDCVNDTLALTTGKEMYRGHLSSLGQYVDDGGDWRRASTANIPVVGSVVSNGYNVVTGTDFLTGQELDGYNRASAGCFLVSDVTGFIAGGMMGVKGKNVSILEDSVRAAASAVASKQAAGTVAKLVTHGHHPLPKFLGGFAKQVLSRLNPSHHKELHGAIRANLKNAGIPLRVGGRGGSAMDWAKYMRANPSAQRLAFDAVLDASRYIDSKYGTSITREVWNNITNGSFTIYP